MSEEALGEAVELLVVGHDEVRVARDDEPRDVDASIDERVELGQQHRGIDDDAVADDRGDARIENAGGHELERELLTVDDDAVPRIVSPLIANDKIHVARQEVGQFSFAFVTPLGSDYDGCGHWTPSRRPRCTKSLP